MAESKNNAEARLRKRRVLLAVGVNALLLLLGVALVTVRVAVAAYRLQDDARALQTLGAKGLVTSQPGGWESAFATTFRDYADFRAAVGPFANALPLLGWLPRYGGDLRNAPTLLELADETVAAAQDTTTIGSSITAGMAVSGSNNAFSTAGLLGSLQAAAPLAERVQNRLADLAQTRQRIDAASLSPSLRTLVEQLDRWYPTWKSSVDLLASGPALLGTDRPRTFLLIAENSDELRATGGFVSGVALVRVDRGQITVGNYEDSFAIYDETKRHPSAPDPLYKYMYAWQWLFRDANWSPDVPTSARQLIQLYALDRGITADGLIAVDLRALPGLVEAVGPLTLPGDQTPVDAASVMKRIQANATMPPVGGQIDEYWWSHRKDYAGEVLKSAMDRILSGSCDPAKLAPALANAVLTKDMLVYIEGDSRVPREVFPPEASLYEGTGDALMLVDSNVGFNKVDVSVGRQIDYAVDIQPTGDIRATTTITYTNRSAASDGFCVHQPLYFSSYAESQQGCYWDYLRVLAPSEAILRSATGVANATTSSELQRVVFGGYLVLPRAEAHQVRFVYDVPSVAGAGKSYTLHLERQPGAPTISVTVRVSLPAGWKVQTSSPAPVSISDSALEYSITLDRDREISLTFAQPSWPADAHVPIGAIAVLALMPFVYGWQRRRRRDGPALNDSCSFGKPPGSEEGAA
ncbi:MAG: DUF4012 domain-containing protein [Chloroflexi bacterium]|nr:DUF4012 domain-containing protein [Chloroflexota bacterium]